MFTACHVLKECQTNANHDPNDLLDKGTSGHRGQRQHPLQNVVQDANRDGAQFPRDRKTADLQTITNSQMLCRRTITENLVLVNGMFTKATTRLCCQSSRFILPVVVSRKQMTSDLYQPSMNGDRFID